jgi:hypothetical protein
MFGKQKSGFKNFSGREFFCDFIEKDERARSSLSMT